MQTLVRVWAASRVYLSRDNGTTTYWDKMAPSMHTAHLSNFCRYILIVSKKAYSQHRFYLLMVQLKVPVFKWLPFWH